jgi:glutaredoxin
MTSDLMDFVRVDGKDNGDITLYALSTCIWCKKTKELLTSLGVSFNYVYVDLLKGEDRECHRRSAQSTHLFRPL